MNLPQQKQGQTNPAFYEFINEEILPQTDLNSTQFWHDLEALFSELAPINQSLLQQRNQFQTQIDAWHKQHQGDLFKQQEYTQFLTDIGYIVDEVEDFEIETDNVDEEIASIAGPQLVVPLKNARFALNAANARWGSLYDALYGTNVIPQTGGLGAGPRHNPARAKHVISYAKDFLDSVFPLSSGSHHNVSSYVVYYQNLLAFFPDGSSTGLTNSSQFVALCGSKNDPTSIVLKNNGLHIEIQIDRHGIIGSKDIAGIDDIQVESALTTIMDFEDSVAAVDTEDKLELYRNWLGLMDGSLQASFQKNGQQVIRQAEKDKMFRGKDGENYRLKGKALLIARNVGHLMDSDLMQDSNGINIPEGIIDCVVTALIGSINLGLEKPLQNSKQGSIYIVKPKMHGPEEVAFSCQLFSKVEDMLDLQPNTLKIGIMDEERRTSINLKSCIYEAKDRVVFINTGFLDRTGDEIHTSMQAGAFLPKEQIKQQSWIKTYEQRNVDIGLRCGLPGKAQIGKGMWAMPNEMSQMMDEKIEHPLAGANTAWVPSPTAATLHALHYHKVDVFNAQRELAQQALIPADDLLLIPLLDKNTTLSTEEINDELDNNIQGILGYVVRWVEQGVGCSKVPDINNIDLMEDRATLRISSQLISNWLLHGICESAQVKAAMQRMARIVDEQNLNTENYQAMAPNTGKSIAFKAASDLIFKGEDQPNGYTEPLLHHYRIKAKQQTIDLNAL